MKLTSHLAQSIVDKMMKQIPYNINMMNESGYVIASGDKKRISTLHIGAQEAIRTRKPCIMDRPHGKNGLPGVNTPVIFEGKVVGVIGITGDPEKVAPLGSLLKVATELLLNQKSINQQQQERKIELNRFLYQWIQVNDNIENHPELILEAKRLNIDVSYPRWAIAIQGNSKKAVPLDNEDYEINFSSETIIVLTKLESTINRYLNLAKKNTLKVGIGNLEKNIGQSVNEALHALQLGKIFNDENFSFYDDISFIDILLKNKLPFEKLVSTFAAVSAEKSGEELINSLISYIKNNEDISETAKALFIHRNTLTYRLKKIQTKFGLNPKNTTDLFQLYIGLIYFLRQRFENLEKK
ncbi:CdaR family transcriptional regulator [Ligilactobacillus acidipiscis]|uniref:CdaR family transcriptional regulator n=1 Tax=Ligilactobacillus acidipiscis TaxID=89059 RepID=UPI0023F72E7F|nr:sugar diacid recognition domain-containing protein [Ligilactobacillus acidipiscis]WEV57514.1 helix-turn-helix domain-containing protein [Ligilactobacillus acidipiscis]